MRPIDRPSQDRMRTPNADYTLLGTTLLGTFGAYCVACEAPLPSGVQVEHRLAKLGRKDSDSEAHDYDSFDIQYLTACGPCNVAKGTQLKSVANLGLYLWPDAHNTVPAFQFAADGTIHAYEGADAFLADLAPGGAAILGLTGELRAALNSKHYQGRAAETITLWNLNRVSAITAYGGVAGDIRVRQRQAAYEAATALASQAPPPDGGAINTLIAYAVRATGFWTLWLHRFVQAGRRDLVALLLSDPRLTAAFPRQASCVAFTNGTLTLGMHAAPEAYTAHNRDGSEQYVAALGTEADARRKGVKPTALTNKRGRGEDVAPDDDQPRKRARHDVVAPPVTQPAALANTAAVTAAPATSTSATPRRSTRRTAGRRK